MIGNLKTEGDLERFIKDRGPRIEGHKLLGKIRPAQIAMHPERVVASGDLTLTTAVQDVPDAEITVTVPGLYEITGTFTFNISVTGVGSCSGTLDVDGVAADEAVLFNTSGTGIATVSQTWQEQAEAGDVIKLTASKVINAGTAAVSGAHTTINAKRIG